MKKKQKEELARILGLERLRSATAAVEAAQASLLLARKQIRPILGLGRERHRLRTLYGATEKAWFELRRAALRDGIEIDPKTAKKMGF